MDATCWVPRIGAACAALMLLASTAQASEVRREAIPNVGAHQIHFFDPAAENDNIVVEPDAEDGIQFVVFKPQNGATLASNSGFPCDDVGSGARSCEVFGTYVGIMIHAGGGDDRFNLLSLPNPNPAAEYRDLMSLFYGEGGDDWFIGSKNPDRIEGGSGDDFAVGAGDGDYFTGGSGIDTIQVDGPGPWSVTLDDVANDGRRNGGTSNVAPDVEVLVGGPLGDVLTGTMGKQTLDGRDGNDVLNGGLDVDAISGGDGDDAISARDGAVDGIDCGTGADTVTADWNDVVLGCETVDRSARDDDGDGSPFGTDCNDGNAAITPGAGDVPGNGVDENCDGSDAVVDGDRDGAAAGADCDDANPARRPGAVDVPANGIDEDCSGADAKRAAVAATFSSGWSVFTGYTKITKLEVKGAPAGAKLQVRCKGKGCPFKRKSVKLRNGGAKLTKLFKGQKLKPGAVIELRVSAAGTTGKVQRLAIRNRRDPKRSALCLAPGASKPSKCS